MLLVRWRLLVRAAVSEPTQGVETLVAQSSAQGFLPRLLRLVGSSLLRARGEAAGTWALAVQLFLVASVLRLRTTQSAQPRLTRVRNSSAKLLVLLATWRVSA